MPNFWPTAFVLFLLSGDLCAENDSYFKGSAIVVDGDSLRIGDTSIRLFGIDAPERNQSCMRDGVSRLCGAEASSKLRALTEGADVECYRVDTDRYGRIVAVCHAGDIELGAAMVLSGLAVAFTKYGGEYVKHNAFARESHRGLWAGEFVFPWDWRKGERLGSGGSKAEVKEDGCQIKGNINSKGVRIYHAPGMPSYTRTKVNPAKGERWFCTENEALEAGWRAPR